MKGKKKAREVQPKPVTCWMLRGEHSILPGCGYWMSKSFCEGHIKSRGYALFRPIKVRIVPVLPKKRGARR